MPKAIAGWQDCATPDQDHCPHPALFMSTKKYRPAPLDRCSSAYNPAQT